jgi:hypothetical protein
MKMDDELKKYLDEILVELKKINGGIEYISSSKAYDLHDICSRLEDIDTSINLIDKSNR